MPAAATMLVTHKPLGLGSLLRESPWLLGFVRSASWPPSACGASRALAGNLAFSLATGPQFFLPLKERPWPTPS